MHSVRPCRERNSPLPPIIPLTSVRGNAHMSVTLQHAPEGNQGIFGKMYKWVLTSGREFRLLLIPSDVGPFLTFIDLAIAVDVLWYMTAA